MRALVIGNEGFVGRHLCPMLREVGYEVVGTEDFDNFIDGNPYYGFDVVVHLGANIVNVNDRMQMGMKAYDDILLDYQVCRWVENNPPNKCFVAMSSCAVDYPGDPYCIVKRTLESFTATLHKKDIPVVTLRPFSGYGPDQSEEYPFRAIFERALRKEDPLTVWGGDQIRDWLYIDDLCAAILAAIEKFPRGKTYEVGTGIGHSLKDVAKMIAHGVGYDPEIFCDQSKPSSSPRRVAQRWGVPNKMAEMITATFFWQPGFSLDDGIKMAVGYFKSQGRL